MVLEDLFESENVINHPVVMMFLAVIVAGISIWVSAFTFPAYTSVLAISFVVVALMPLIHHVYITEEENELKILQQPYKVKSGGITFLGRHFELIKIYAFFFIGITLSYAMWFAILPESREQFCISGACIDVPSKSESFKEQIKTLEGISKLRSSVTGKATFAASGSGGFLPVFELIFGNNIEVLVLSIITSFLYGAGALFLIGWNASVIGVLIGQNILAANHFSFLGLLPHGIPEVLGYFIGAIAGGVISIAITKRQHIGGEMGMISKDVIAMLFLAVFSLFIGGLIEAFLIVKEETLGLALSVIYLLLVVAMIALGGPAEMKRHIEKHVSVISGKK